MSQSSLFEYFKKDTKKDLELLICEDFKEALELESVAKFFQKDVLLFPDLRPTFGDDLRVYKEELHQLFSALRSYNKAKKKPLVIAPLKTLLFHFPKEELLQSYKIDFAQKLDLKAFKEQMLFWGYNFVDMVQVEGEISFRGDIIDIFAPSLKSPVRISLFDDEVEQIKYFELETQRSDKEELDSIEVTSAFFSLDEEGFESLGRSVKSSPFNSLSKDIASLGYWYLGANSFDFMQGKKIRLSRDLTNLLKDAYGINNPQVSRAAFELPLLPDSDDFKDLVVSDVATLLSVHKNKKITIIAANEASMKQAGIFDNKEIKRVYAPYILNILSDDELVISLNKPDKKRRRRKSSILLDDLKTGDYVVHEDYGVGIFEAIEQA
ncbi:MAG: CarD family transcriptional regulator, partial [Sulfurimonas sp.]